MRKLLLLAPALLVAATASAQIKKSATLIGGDFSYLRQEQESTGINKSQSGRFNLLAGRAIKENTVVGLTIGYAPLSQTDYRPGGDSMDITNNLFLGGVFYREYKPLTKNLYFFGQANLEGITGTYKQVFRTGDRNQTSAQKGGSFSISAGISYQIFKRVLVEVSTPNLFNIQYLVTNSTSDRPGAVETTAKQFLVNSSLSNFNIGFLAGGFRIIL